MNLHGIGDIDMLALTQEQRSAVITSLSSSLRRAKATQALSEVLAAGQPEFTEFERASLTRLNALCSFLVGRHHEKNVLILQELDIPTLVPVGLCVPLRSILRMEESSLQDIIERARAIGAGLQQAICSRQSISDAIMSSENRTIIREYSWHVQQYVSITPQNYISRSGSVGFTVPVVHGPRFQRLTSIALQRMVTMYLPFHEMADCVVRLTVAFDATLLKNLFGYAPDPLQDEMQLYALRDQIGPQLGDDVYHSVKGTAVWGEDNMQITGCVKAVAYPGHVIVIDVLIPRNDALALVNPRAEPAT